MIEERAMAGAKALSGWLSSCRVMVGEVKGATFRKLKETLVETVLLYGAEVWGGCRVLEAVEQVNCNIKVKVRSGAQDHHLLVNLLHLKLVLVVLLLALGKVCHEQFVLHRDVFLSISVFKVLLQVGYGKVTLKGGRLWEG